MLTDEQREALDRCPDCGHDWSGHNDEPRLAGWIKCRGQRGLGSIAGCKCELTLKAAVEAIVSEALAARETELREQIAGEIEGLAEWDGAGWPNHAYEIKAAAADIARGDDR